MKTLYVVRHAKSSWDNPELADFERPLNERGKTDAPRMAKRLKERDVHPSLLLSSPAKRAFSTARRIAEMLNYPKKNIRTEERLFHADTGEIIAVLKSISDKNDVVMLFGHNPGLTELVNEIGEHVDIDNIPTCGVVALRFHIKSWNELGSTRGELLFFDYPKSDRLRS
jgi:phosphohistidine phosphatase